MVPNDHSNILHPLSLNNFLHSSVMFSFQDKLSSSKCIICYNL